MPGDIDLAEVVGHDYEGSLCDRSAYDLMSSFVKWLYSGKFIDGDYYCEPDMLLIAERLSAPKSFNQVLQEHEDFWETQPLDYVLRECWKIAMKTISRDADELKTLRDGGDIDLGHFAMLRFFLDCAVHKGVSEIDVQQVLKEAGDLAVQLTKRFIEGDSGSNPP